MNIQHLTSGKVRLTSASGSVTEILTGRTHREVVTTEDRITCYTDGDAPVRTSEDRTEFTRYEVLKALKLFPELYESLVKVYQEQVEVALYWNSVIAIDITNPDFKAICNQLGITDETVQAVIDKIEE